MHSRLRAQSAGLSSIALRIAVAFISTGSLWAAPPANDAFAGREEVIASFGVTTSGTNVDATTQGSEQVPTGFTAASHQASIWYEWTPDFSGWYEINTASSSVDTVLSVWTGPGIGSLTLVHANDDGNGGPTSRVWLNATGFTTYYICIAGKSGKPRGNTELAVFFIPDPLVTSVSAISFSPAPVNVTSAAATLTCDVTMQANATPDLGYFRLYDPFGSSFTEVSFSVANRTSGNNSSGVYRVTLSIPAHAQPGSYRWALRVQNTSGSKVGSFGWEELSRAALAIPTVQNTGAVDTYLHWQKLHQLSGTGSGQTEDFDGDGITNLEEFTFGSNPKVGGRALVATSGGTIISLGLPDLQVIGSGDQRRIKATFVRRVSDASGMSCVVHFGNVPLTLSPAASIPTVIATDGTYEVVTVEDQIAIPASERRFGAVKVTYPFP